MKKILMTLVVLVVLVGGIAWYFVSFRLDDMIRQQIEVSGSEVLGTQVTVGALSTDLKNGSLTIASITVANPEGYENPNAFTLNGIEAAVDYETLEVKRIVVDQPEIVVEEKAGKTNFTDLLSNIESPPEQEPTDSAEPPPEITIHHFRMNEARAAFESKSLDHYSDLKVKSVEIDNISGTPQEVGEVIVTEIVEKVISAAAVELLKAKASEKMDGILGRD